MIQLFVDSREVILPEEFSLTLIEENPLITRNGEFTLDITISLLEPVNAVTFGFLNRLNKSSIPKDATAYLIVDGKVRNGKVVFLNNNDVEVNFQFIAGNSELNYIAKTDTKIWELDWGTETAVDYARAAQSLLQIGYSGSGFGFVCTPVKLGDVVVNNYEFKLETIVAPDAVDINTDFPIDRITGDIVIQPYLMYYVEKLPGLLGFTLDENVLLTDPVANNMYMVNGVNSLSYKDFLPDITIYEFIDMVENTFNVAFLIDSVNKTVSIKKRYDSLLNRTTLQLEDVLDAYSRTLDDSDNEDYVKFDFDKFSYDLPGDLYYKYQCLSEVVKSSCTIQHYANLAAIKSAVVIPDDNDKMKIFVDDETGEMYGKVVPTILLYGKRLNFLNHLILINKFRSIGDGTKELSLAFYPTYLGAFQKMCSWDYNNSGTITHYDIPLTTQIPFSTNEYFQFKTSGFKVSVEEGITTIKRNSKFEVALYGGKISIYNGNNANTDFKTKYPLSYVDYWPEFGDVYPIESIDKFNTWVENYYKPAALNTLRLSRMYEYYGNDQIFDTDMLYEFSIKDNPQLTVNNLYIIEHNKYVPVRFEREKTNKEERVKGYFFRLL